MIFLQPAPAFAGDQVRRTTIFFVCSCFYEFSPRLFFPVSDQIGAALITNTFKEVFFYGCSKS